MKILHKWHCIMHSTLNLRCKKLCKRWACCNFFREIIKPCDAPWVCQMFIETWGLNRITMNDSLIRNVWISITNWLTPSVNVVQASLTVSYLIWSHVLAMIIIMIYLNSKKLTIIVKLGNDEIQKSIITLSSKYAYGKEDTEKEVMGESNVLLL